MKTIKRELAHVGMFGQDGTVITRQHLADCKETFDGDAPVTLGHKLADWMPRFGTVKKLELSAGGDSLVGELEEQDVLADAREAGFFPKVSVGINRRKADGKFYLHHAGYLGAIPPKIRDLKIFSEAGVIYCGEGRDVVVFSDEKPQSTAHTLQPAADSKTAAQPAQQPAPAAGSPAKEEEDVELKEENEQLKKELADSNAARLATAKDGLKKAMDGRVPKGKQNLVLALADALGPTDLIELADEEGKKESVTGLEILRRILEVIPKPVAEGRTDLGDQPDAGKPVDMSKLMARV